MFQVPWFAEHLFFWPFANRGFRLAKPGSFSAEDLARYHEAWTQPGAVHATINWYRASFRSMMRDTIVAGARLKHAETKSASIPIRVPSLVLWGEKDMTLSTWLARDSAAQCIQSTLRTFPDASHWLQHDKPQEVTQAILDFLDRQHVQGSTPSLIGEGAETQSRFRRAPSAGRSDKCRRPFDPR
jgi:pimeloyl-ACP methyl ester carboxylesterase